MVKIRNWYKNLSLKKAFALMALCTLIVTIFLSIFSLSLLGNLRDRYFDAIGFDNSIESYTNDKEELNFVITEVDSGDVIGNILTLTILTTPIIIFILVMITMGSVFYNSRLRDPINQLRSGAKSIQNKDLDFSLQYDSADEMGQLCHAFEQMRKELLHRYQYEWRKSEERLSFNRAFSHDVRTPITIIKGHLQVLEKSLNDGDVNQYKINQTITLSLANLTKIETYLNMMNSVNRLSEIQIETTEICMLSFIEQFSKDFSIYGSNYNIEVMITFEVEEKYLVFDSVLVTRVMENIIGNAVRFAREKVNVEIYYKDRQLCFEVLDDGKGFDDQAKTLALQPFYKQSDDESHLGLGLYISDVITKQMSGKLKIEESTAGGFICLKVPC